MDELYFLLKIVYLGVFAPMILYFMYNVITDPAFPAIMKVTWKYFKARTVASLSKKEVNPSAIKDTKPKRREKAAQVHHRALRASA